MEVVVSKLEEIMARAHTAGQNAKAQSLADFPGSTEKAEASYYAARATYLEASLERYIENAERAKQAQIPQCAPGWRLMEAYIGDKGAGKKVWIEYQTFTDDGAPFARLYHCHIPDASGCRKVLIGERTPFSAEQVSAWEAQAVAADSQVAHDTPLSLHPPCAYSASLAADTYQRTLDAQHYANRRAA
jgi:hypothetical protein